MILFGSFVRQKGFGLAFASVTKRLMAACKATREWNTPRLRRRLVSLAKAAELVPDALGRGGNRGRIGDVKLEGAGIRSNAPRGCLAVSEVARPDEHGEALAG